MNIRIGIWTILVVATLVGGCGCRTVKDRIDVTTVENDIRAHLAIGSSKADVIAYLDNRKIAHSLLQQVEVSLDGKVAIPNSHTENCIIPDVRKDGMVQTSVQIDFKFDDSDSKLISYSVREVYKGP